MAGIGASQRHYEVNEAMSFSSGVKEELAHQGSQARHCRIAFIAAVFHLYPVLTSETAGIRTENASARLCLLIERTVESLSPFITRSKR